MDLESAIKHAEEAAEEEEKQAIWLRSREGNPNYKNCVKRAKEHRQLVEWLKDYKRLLEQEPKTRHWEWVQYDSNPNIGNWHCSECRTIIPHMPEETDNTPIYNWCPICGAKMVGQQERSE